MKPSPKAVRTFLFSTLFFLFLTWTAALPSASAQTIEVTSANPSSAAQGTVNLNVTVKGKGFKNGAQAKWFVTGTTNPSGVTVNSTTFVSGSELSANITVADDATIADFDIAVVNTNGRSGKGTELFAVTAKGGGNQNSCPALTPMLTAANNCTTTLPGCLDVTFGSTGVVLTDTTGGVDYQLDFEQAITPLLQPDGKIVAVGYSRNNGSSTGVDFTLVRYNIDGSLDTTFGSGGIARDAATSADDRVETAALQPDGKILAAGDSTGGIVVVARFNPDGTLDATFGAGGNVLLSSPSRKIGWSAYSVAVQTDGKILLGTYGYGAVVRLNSNGSLDTTFGNGGIVAVEGTASGLATQRFTWGTVTEERILVVDGSRAATGGQTSDFLVMRLMPNGTVDTSFGPSGTGKIYTDFCTSNDGPRAMAVDAAGNIVVAGSAGAEFGIARYTPGGIPDSSFGDPISGSSQRTGKTRVDFFGSWDQGWGVVVQPDGKLVIGGNVEKPDPNYYVVYFALARFNADGTLDTSFGTGGVVATDYGTPAGNDFGRRLVLQPDGKIVIVGAAAANGTMNFAVARYWH